MYEINQIEQSLPKKESQIGQKKRHKNKKKYIKKNR
jgi:hypothetical protein